MPRGRQSAQRIDKELRDAGTNLKTVLMEYKSDAADPDEKASSYIVEPYSYRNEGKTFFGFDQTAKSIKAFKTANIVRVSPLGKSFKPRWPVELKNESGSSN
jgi:predicted DNA-binding transcriptional regulator YafY